MDSVLFNTTKTKQLNIELVKSALINLSNATKKEIADLTGLSVATCGNILNELLETGEVEEIDLKEPSGGRPARCFVYNPNHSFVACIYIDHEQGRNSIFYAVANMVGEIISEKLQEIDHVNLDMIDNLVEELIDQHKIIKAIGIGVPGVVTNGVIVDDCDIEELLNVPLEDHLGRKYGLKITVENDMNLKALGFYKKQNYSSDKSIAVINFPKDNCSGSGIIVDGHILKGNTNFAGEVSYLPFGCSRDQLIEKLNDPNQYQEPIINSLVSIIAIINPDTVALTGEVIKPDMLDLIIDGCLQKIPRKHMPKIIIRENIHADYLFGLITVTIESLRYDVKLVKKRL